MPSPAALSRRIVPWLLALPCLALGAEEGNLYQQAVHILGGNGNVVSRWDEPIRFAVIGGSETPAREIVAEAAAIAGLELHYPANDLDTVPAYLSALESTPPFALAEPCDGSDGKPCFNFVVLLASHEQMRALVSTIPLAPEYGHTLSNDPALHCFFAPFRNGRRQIRQVVIYVRDDLGPAMTRTCLQEEIYQAFGLFGDYTGSTLFSFNNVVAPKAITRYDRELLAALYDERVKPGYPVHMVATIFVTRIDATAH